MRLAFRSAALIGVVALCAAAAPMTDLATPFVASWDRTQNETAPERVAAFKRDIAARFPAFYDAGRFGGDTKRDALIGDAIARFGPNRDGFAAKAAGFGREFPRHVASFRVAFPDFELTTPVYLLHSLGEMDGGTRDLDGKTVLIFGIDVMVAVHGSDDEAPFFDHELFHVYHARAFPECPQVWCTLWSEGLAVYVARRLNPGATDAQLLLTSPTGMLAETKAHLGEALADLQESLASSEPATVNGLFSGGNTPTRLPRRRGYYLGLLVAEEIGRTRDLASLAKLTPAEAKPLVFNAVSRLRAQAG